MYGMRIDRAAEDYVPPNPSQQSNSTNPVYDSNTTVPPPVPVDPMNGFDNSNDNMSPPTPMPMNSQMMQQNDPFEMNNNCPPNSYSNPTGSPPMFRQRMMQGPPPQMNQKDESDLMVDEDQSPQPRGPFHNPFNQQMSGLVLPPIHDQPNQGRMMGMGERSSFMRVNSFVSTKSEKQDLQFDKSVQNPFSIFRRQSSSNLLLPTIRPGKSKNPQCNTIHGKTLARFFQKKRKHSIILVDCRFPYEYQGGTIRGSVNIYQEHVLKAYFFTKKKVNSIVVFYCEYSSKRGPKMYESMRKFDREENLEKYPYLDYPQIYLLEGGYRKFYKRNKKRGYGLCVPDTYCKMDNPRFSCEFQRAWKEMKDSFKSKMNRGGFCGGKRRRRRNIQQEAFQRHNSFNLRYLNRQ